MGNEGTYQVIAGKAHRGRHIVDRPNRPMRRPPFRARVQWHTWMPWYEFSRIGGEAQDLDEHANGTLLPVLGIALVTLVAAVLLPQFSLLITGVGGGSIVWTLTCANGDGRRIIRGMRIVGLPSPRMFLALGADMAVEDVTTLWHGHPRSDGLLTGPNEATGWTRAETIDRYRLWCAVRESLSPADRSGNTIAAVAGFAHEELMDALIAHRLRAIDLDVGRHMPALPVMLELNLLASPDALNTAPMPVDAGRDYGTDTAEAGFDTATGRDVAICRPSHRDRQNGGVRPRHERPGRAGLGVGQCRSPFSVSRLGRTKYVPWGGQHQRDDVDLEAAPELIDDVAGHPTINGGGHGDE